MSSQLIVHRDYIIYFHIRGSFLTTFYTSFWKRVHNSKEIVNIQGLFVLTVGLQKEYILFIDCLYYLSVHCYSCCFLYTVSWRYMKDYFHVSINILFYIMFYIINTMKKHWTLLCQIRTFDTKKVPI